MLQSAVGKRLEAEDGLAWTAFYMDELQRHERVQERGDGMRAIDADAFKNYIRSGYEEMKHLFNENLKVATLVTESFCKDIDEQPTIQPEPHWIPVTEATPTEDDDYWATFEAETGRFVDWASWYQGRWVVWIDGSPAPLSNVIAWCKPMEPYKGVTE